MDNNIQAMMIFHKIHFIELSICEKAEFLVFIHIYVHRYNLLCLHSLDPCLIYCSVKIFYKSLNREAHDHYVKIGRINHMRNIFYQTGGNE